MEKTWDNCLITLAMLQIEKFLYPNKGIVRSHVSKKKRTPEA
jgi:hypothetical protein